VTDDAVQRWRGLRSPEPVLKSARSSSQKFMGELSKRIGGRSVLTTRGAELEPERREQLRFPIALKLSYSLKSGAHGDGEISNISSAGLLFQAAEQFKVNSKIQVAIAWPYLLNGYCPLRLWVRGRVVRSNRSGTAVALDKYEFRTVGKH
jgi:PilZ domain